MNKKINKEKLEKAKKLMKAWEELIRPKKMETVKEQKMIEKLIRENLMPELDALLKSGYNVNIKNDEGMNALHLAVYYDHLQAVLKILNVLGADVNAKDNKGRTPIFLLSEMNGAPLRYNECEIAKALIKNGADVNAKDKNGMTPFDKAYTSRYNKHFQKILFDAGANLSRYKKQAIHEVKLDFVLLLQKACENIIDEYSTVMPGEEVHKTILEVLSSKEEHGLEKFLKRRQQNE